MTRRRGVLMVLGLISLVLFLNAVLPVNRRRIWPFGEYSMYAPLHGKAKSFSEMVLYGIFRNRLGRFEIEMEDSAYIAPFQWDELRKSMRVFVEANKEDRFWRGLKKLLKHNSARLRQEWDMPDHLVGYRIYREYWSLDLDHFQPRAEPLRRELLVDEDFQ